MANSNTFFVLNNLPSQIVSGASAVLTVPATGLPGFPSPAQASGTALYWGVTDTVAGNVEFDGHPFKIRLVGRVTAGTTSTFTPSVYVGTSATVGSNTAIGAGTASSSLTAGTYNFILEVTLLWDSTTTKMNGSYVQIVNGVAAGPTALTANTAVTTLAGLVFTPTFLFGSTNAANAFQLTEYAIDRA